MKLMKLTKCPEFKCFIMLAKLTQKIINNYTATFINHRHSTNQADADNDQG